MNQTVIKIDNEQYEELAAIKESDGLPIAEQVRRAIREWLKRRNEERPTP